MSDVIGLLKRQGLLAIVTRPALFEFPLTEVVSHSSDHGIWKLSVETTIVITAPTKHRFPRFCRVQIEPVSIPAV